MPTAKLNGRLQIGAAIFAAAKAVDTRLVKARLAAFEGAHRSYAEAQHKVDAAEAQLHAAQAKLGQCDVSQNEALEMLARSLIFDGQPRTNPFAAFGPLIPSKAMSLPIADKAKAVHQLVAAVQRSKGASKTTLQAAQAAEKAANALEQALVPVEKLQAVARDTRHTRDAVAQSWESTLAALKRGARAAADDGAPQLYATLFGRTNHRNGKNGKTAPAEVTPVATPPAPAPTASA
ncbi:MAG: hypothetical protein ACHQ4J_13400 [Candidatus Binatia bacterium]